ncbi:MAG TPA: SprT family zinc-dependent metalloprotease [Aquimonas sp.]|nr:M48 family metallopeptidase [Xanthomonadales bacterium]HRD71473.1 SprT family zinc-dependent metalloprotease [Aquimonas sp.]HRF52907.1 SprT family zinc-dependent metalloprotease [Aquimonas sp.]
MSPRVRRLVPRIGLQKQSRSLRLPDGRDIELLQVIDPRAVRVKLSVSERGARLSLPLGTSDTFVQQFLEQHRAWLQTQWRKHQSAPAPDAALCWGQDLCLPLRGESITLRWQSASRLAVQCDEADWRLLVPPAATLARVQKVIAEFLHSEARTDLGRWLPHYLPGFAHAPGQVRIRPLSSLWGSLSGRNGLSLDLSLILAPSRVFEYVLVHELCHLVQRNHSPAFWHEVGQRLPDWRQQRQWLRSHGGMLKRQLGVLLEAR